MFGPNILLIIYGLIIFWGIFMMWFCFVRYFLTGDIKRVREAVADHCGFSRTHFQRVFKQETGCFPADFTAC